MWHSQFSPLTVAAAVVAGAAADAAAASAAELAAGSAAGSAAETGSAEAPAAGSAAVTAVASSGFGSDPGAAVGGFPAGCLALDQDSTDSVSVTIKRIMSNSSLTRIKTVKCKIVTLKQSFSAFTVYF